MKNENKTLKFKTNINCGGCVAKVSPFLNETNKDMSLPKPPRFNKYMNIAALAQIT